MAPRYLHDELDAAWAYLVSKRASGEYGFTFRMVRGEAVGKVEHTVKSVDRPWGDDR